MRRRRRRGWPLSAVAVASAAVGFAGALARDGQPDAHDKPLLTAERNGTLVHLLSRRPYLARFRGVLDPKQCALVRRHLLDAVVFFDDTDAAGRARVGSRALVGVLRPRYRMQNERQLSLFFPRPPPVLDELYRRVGKLVGAHPSNIEAIYHVYAPGAMPANLHLDNFNKYLFPHRYASVSMFFDNTEDGGTVFPLVARGPTPAPSVSLATLPAAWNGREVEAWHKLINDTRTLVGDDGFAGRRVDPDERQSFRRRALEEALEMCRLGRRAQGPVVPETGTAYMWKNYNDVGEDDVLTMHAGCGASADFKMIGTFFIRDWPGPFQEHSTFWDPLEPRASHVDELQRRYEVKAMQSFRLNHLDRLYDLQLGVMQELQGRRAAAWLERRQRLHAGSLAGARVDEALNEGVEAMAKEVAGKELRWSKVADAKKIF